MAANATELWYLIYPYLRDTDTCFNEQTILYSDVKNKVRDHKVFGEDEYLADCLTSYPLPLTP